MNHFLDKVNTNRITLTKEQARLIKEIISYNMAWIIRDSPTVADTVYHIKQLLDEITKDADK